MDENSRMVIYISIMVLVFSCVLLGYGLFFFGWGVGNGSNGVRFTPSIIVAVGLVIAAINGIASHNLSDQLSKKIDTLPPILKTSVPLVVFIFTLGLSIIIALISLN